MPRRDRATDVAIGEHPGQLAMPIDNRHATAPGVEHYPGGITEERRRPAGLHGGRH
jgi:hypothetical protein